MKTNTWQWVGLCLFSSLFMGVQTLPANGGGYTKGGVYETGTVSGFEPDGLDSVQILDEQLSIALGPSAASVEVRYILKNTGKASTVRFGFPVEELADEENMYVEEPERDAPKNAPSYCRNYKVEVAGKLVASKFEAEPAAAKERDNRRVGLKGWLISKVNFAAGEEKTMRITYDSDYPEGFMSVSDDSSTTAKIFRYRLSTGAAWAGPIQQGRVAVEAKGIFLDEITVLRPVNRFRRDGEKWVWEFANLEPSLADDLEIEAAPAVASYDYRTPSGGHASGQDASKIVDFTERKGEWFISHSNYDVVASSTLPPSGEKTYAATNVRSRDEAAWSEGAPGPGVGQWLEITPEVPQPLRSIGIFPGYLGLFKKNARVKKIEVLLNEDHRFEAKLADEERMQAIPILGYEKPIKKIKLTVQEVYPGSKYEDLCISWINLESKLKRKPNLDPTR